MCSHIPGQKSSQFCFGKYFSTTKQQIDDIETYLCGPFKKLIFSLKSKKFHFPWNGSFAQSRHITYYFMINVEENHRNIFYYLAVYNSFFFSLIYTNHKLHTTLKFKDAPFLGKEDVLFGQCHHSLVGGLLMRLFLWVPWKTTRISSSHMTKLFWAMFS